MTTPPNWLPNPRPVAAITSKLGGEMKFTSLSLYTPLIASLDWARFRLPLPLAIITLLLLLLLLLLLCIKITNMYQFATGIQGSNPLPVGGASTSWLSIGSLGLLHS